MEKIEVVFLQTESAENDSGKHGIDAKPLDIDAMLNPRPFSAKIEEGIDALSKASIPHLFKDRNRPNYKGELMPSSRHRFPLF